jgi:hypothetical protein
MNYPWLFFFFSSFLDKDASRVGVGFDNWYDEQFGFPFPLEDKAW